MRLPVLALMFYLFNGSPDSQVSWTAQAPDLTRPDVGYELLNGCMHQTLFTGSEDLGMFNHGPILHASSNLVFVAWFSHDAYESAPGVRVLASFTVDQRFWSEPFILFDSIGEMAAPGEANGYGLWPNLVEVNGRLYATASVKGVNRGVIGGVIGRIARYIASDGTVDSTTYWLGSAVPVNLSGEGFLPYDVAPNATRRADLADLFQTIQQRSENYPIATAADEGISLCEASYYSLPDGSDVGIHRALWDGITPAAEPLKYRVYATRRSSGGDWPAAVCTEIPNSPSKADCGVLPNGNAFIVGNLQASEETNLRDPLSIAIAEDGMEFSHVYVIRCGGTQCRVRNAGDYKGTGFQYPNTDVLHNDLWVAYSDAKEQICVSRIPLGEEMLSNGDFENGIFFPSGGWGIGGNAAEAEYITGGTSGDTVYSGSRAVSISNPVYSMERWYLVNALLPEARAGQCAKLTAYVKAENMNSANASIVLSFLDASYVELERCTTSIPSDTNWAAFAVGGEAPEGTAYVRPMLVLGAEGSGSTAVVTFDECSLRLSNAEGL